LVTNLAIANPALQCFGSIHSNGEGGMFANLLTALVALLHVYFMFLEMVAWDKPLGLKTFRLTQEFASASKALAMNQGLYNGFLVAGLVWGLWLGDAGFAIKTFFLGCVIVAGIFGALTVSRKILFVQAVPALLALGALLYG
jgi:putative membrane protein